MENTIRRPDAPNHFMILRPVSKRVVVRLPEGPVLAESSNAIRLIECVKTIYDPMTYFQAADLRVRLIRQEKTTHCPLKGDASYFTFNDGENSYPDLAWSYENPFDFSQEIAGLIAFYPSKVVIEEHPV